MSYNNHNIDDEIIEDIIEDSHDCQNCPALELNENQKLILTHLIHSNESDYIIVDKNSKYQNGDFLIVNSRYGRDLAKVNGEIKQPRKILEKNLITIVREATKTDLENYESNKLKEKEAFSVCQEKISHHKLNMKLISAHYLLDEPKILFFFTAENRVDFRELVKDLVAVFKTRIELRQIGVRDESRILGGLAICGRDYCCHGVSDKLNPVSIKMAKEQNLSLNSMKISGPCGRLLCCLSYEYDFYKSERKLFPAVGERILCDGQDMKVTEVNVVSRVVRIVSQDGVSKTVPAKDLWYNEKNRSWKVSEE